VYETLKDETDKLGSRAAEGVVISSLGEERAFRVKVQLFIQELKSISPSRNELINNGKEKKFASSSSIG